MIELTGRANMDYMVRLANDPEWAAAELERIQSDCAERGALYLGKPVPVPIKPHFISPRQRQLLQTSVARLHGALETFIEMWLDSPQLQKLWGVTDEELALYLADPGYENAIQIARFDAFLQDFDLKFLEFNCDSPGGTGYADVIHHVFLDMFDRNDLGQNYVVSNRQRLLHLSDTMRTCYEQWREARLEAGDDRPESPFVVVSDWRDVGTVPDIELTIGHLAEQGLEAAFADPRDLERRDDGLYLDDRRVDLVYKRVIVKELVESADARDLAETYKAGQVCMVNAPRSVIVGNKKILAALRRPDVLERLTPLQRQAVRDFVPWTEVLRDGKAEFHGFQVNLKDFVVDNKDLLVLKAAQSYGGKDVFLGFETDDATWQGLVDEHLDNNTWIVQALVRIPKELFPVIRDGQVQMDLMNVNINPLAFGGQYAGSYTRLSKKNVINVSFGGGMTPTMTLEPKGE